jgi:hypothetical protein
MSNVGYNRKNIAVLGGRIHAGKKHPRRERTYNWQQIQQYTLWPEQQVNELLRPVVLFHEDAAERARETGAAERTLQWKETLYGSNTSIWRAQTPQKHDHLLYCSALAHADWFGVP